MLRLPSSPGFTCGIAPFAMIALALSQSQGPRAAADPPADLAVVHAKVLTLDPRSRVAEGVAIRGGRIIAVGSMDEVQRAIGPATRVIDAAGRTVIPGIIDSHVHAIDVARNEAAAPYQELTSIEAIQTWVRDAAHRAPAGTWIWTPRLFPTRLREHRFPTREELDAATTDRPVVVDCAYAQILNSAALKAAGIGPGSPDPEGGTVARTPAGEPTGLLFNAERLLAAHRPPLTEMPVDGLAAVLRAYNAVGITSVIERATDRAGYRTYETLARDGRLSVRATVSFRVVSDGSVEDTERFISTLGLRPGQGDEWLRVGPLKIFADGGILGGSSFMREPYGPSAGALYGIRDPHYRGKLTIPPPQLLNIIRTGHRLGWQLATHVTGDAGVDAVLDAVETVDREQSMRARRFTLIHAYFPNPDTARRAARLGVVIDTQPAWFYEDADALTDALGEARMRHFIGLRQWLDAGLHVAINTDHMFGLDPVRSLNPFLPFLTMQTAVTRGTAGGRVIGPDQAVSVDQALRMMTQDAAFLSFDESQKGTLEVGKLGDLAVLSADPLTTPPERLRDITVLQTIVGGRVVYERQQANTAADKEVRIGVIGLDSSHAVAFTELINDASRPDHVPGGRVVAAYKGGSPGLPNSDTRIERFTADVTGRLGVPLVDSIETLLSRVDAVLLLSVDARQHLAQVRPVLDAHKRVFIDKPIAASYRDTRAIADLARDTGTPFFSSSSLRYAPHILHLREKAGAGGGAPGALTWGPAPTESYLPDLFWYGIHSVESLYALMGTGCESVSRLSTPGADLVSCRWRDGRIGTIRGIRDGDHAYGAVVFGTQNVTETGAGADYAGLVAEIMKFFKSGVPPVPPDETLELIAFMEAAEISKARGGAPVPLTEVTGVRQRRTR